MVEKSFVSNWNLLSWDSLHNNLYKIQNRLFKSIYVFDMSKAFSFQKLILSSNMVRLLAVRQVTQLDSKRKLSGIDGLLFLTFTEKFQLCQDLKLNLYNWNPSLVKLSKVVKKNGMFVKLNLYTIRDRSWHCLIKFCLEPAHEATFSFRSFGARFSISVYYLQRLFFYNLNFNSYGGQKRIMLFQLKSNFSNFNFVTLINRLIITRALKLGIFRCLNLGFLVDFTEDSLEFPDLASLFSNLLLNGLESLHPSCIRYANHVVFFLKPFDNEFLLFIKLKDFLSSVGFSLSSQDFLFASSFDGFDFLGWRFRVYPDGTFFSFPSYISYQRFLLRVKHILNNSNYGAVWIS